MKITLALTNEVPKCVFGNICVALINHLGNIQQVDLEEEAESAACDLVGSSTNGIAQFAGHRQTTSLWRPLDDKERGEHAVSLVLKQVMHLFV